MAFDDNMITCRTINRGAGYDDMTTQKWPKNGHHNSNYL